MLQPKKVKRRKHQKGRVRKIAQRGYKIAFGSFALKVLEPGWITARQLEAGRITINHTLKRAGVMWTRVFPYKPITKKPAEVRMGKGKGAPEYWVAPVEPGRILYEIEGVKQKQATEAIRLAGKKFGLKTRMVVREDYVETEE